MVTRTGTGITTTATTSIEGQGPDHDPATQPNRPEVLACAED